MSFNSKIQKRHWTRRWVWTFDWDKRRDYGHDMGFLPLLSPTPPIFPPPLPFQAPQSLFISKKGWSGNRHIYHIPCISVLLKKMSSRLGFFFTRCFFPNVLIGFSDLRVDKNRTRSRSIKTGVSVLERTLSRLSSRLRVDALLLRCTCSCATGQLAWLFCY